MDLLFYATDTEGTGKPLWNLFQGLNDKHKSEFYLKIDDLANRLRRHKSDPTIAVLLAASRKDLVDLLSIRDLFDRTRILLILPDRNKDTINKGLTLFPRFLNYLDGNFDWVTAVLHKMVSNNNGDKRFG
jgi:hypothetical protein